MSKMPQRRYVWQQNVQFWKAKELHELPVLQLPVRDRAWILLCSHVCKLRNECGTNGHPGCGYLHPDRFRIAMALYSDIAWHSFHSVAFQLSLFKGDPVILAYAQPPLWSGTGKETIQRINEIILNRDPVQEVFCIGFLSLKADSLVQALRGVVVYSCFQLYISSPIAFGKIHCRFY